MNADENMILSMDNRAASIVISDPWEIVARDSEAGIGVMLLKRMPSSDGTKERILAALVRPMEWKSGLVRYVVIEPRVGTELLADLDTKRAVECNILGVPDAAADGPPPWGADRWRGGFAAIGAVQIS